MAMIQGNEKVARPAEPKSRRRGLGSKTGSGALTDAKILALKPPAAGQVEFLDSVVPGLRLRVGVSGTKTFHAAASALLAKTAISPLGDIPSA